MTWPYSSSPNVQPFSPSQNPQFTDGTVTEGTVTYTQTMENGKIVYHPFKAVRATYQTPSGVIHGIQWLPVEATHVLPVGAIPAGREFAESMSSHAYHDQRKEEERLEEKIRKDKAKLKREEEELRKARERDVRERRKSINASTYGPVPTPPQSGGGFASPYPSGPDPYDQGRKHSVGNVVDLDARFRTLDMERERDPYADPYGRGPGANPPVTRARTTSFNSGPPPRPLSRNMPERPFGGAVDPYAPSGPGYTGAPGAYPSPYASGRASPNPYGTSAAPAPYHHSPDYPTRSMTDPFPRSASPYSGPGPLPTYPKGHVLEGQPIQYAPGQLPQGPRSRAPSPIPGAVAGGIGYTPYPKPGQLLSFPTPPTTEAPFAFRRAPMAVSYTAFDPTKIQDMDAFLEHIPRMPLVLQSHDVMHEDWIRCMEDLARAWTGTFANAELGQAPVRPAVQAAHLIDTWNSNFFGPRSVQLVLYKGRERRSGSQFGRIDRNLPAFDDDDDDSDNSSSLSEDDSSDDEHYSQQYGAYGRAPGHINEALEAKQRKKAKKAEKKRRHKEKKFRKKERQRSKAYSLYLTWLPPRASDPHYGAQVPRPPSRVGSVQPPW